MFKYLTSENFGDYLDNKILSKQNRVLSRQCNIVLNLCNHVINKALHKIIASNFRLIVKVALIIITHHVILAISRLVRPRLSSSLQLRFRNVIFILQELIYIVTFQCHILVVKHFRICICYSVYT